MPVASDVRFGSKKKTQVSRKVTEVAKVASLPSLGCCCRTWFGTDWVWNLGANLPGFIISSPEISCSCLTNVLS